MNNVPFLRNGFSKYSILQKNLSVFTLKLQISPMVKKVF
ncbi:hypothetical protein SCOR_15345 [Sulfidibacter corallicola]